ncbi:hypothetical protein K2173_025262 [Erythroxylum novogranatense]|uniref:Dehydrin n=1 Tax=Erythroxylum novogranatense TaxID=1862640 RepID=A0AAV8UDE4_9ROSI|nr:hypothetical protein K2173_025262 [Erythroxylum novogranatense]
MADETENPIESMVEKISEKIHDHSSSSCSDSEKKEKKPESPSLVKEKIYRLFGREKPVHGVLGGGKGRFEEGLTTPCMMSHSPVPQSLPVRAMR